MNQTMSPLNSSSPINTPLRIPLADAAMHHQSLLAGPPQNRALQSGQVSLAPGDSVHAHSTEEGEELLIPLAGHGKVIFLGMDPLLLEPGSVLYIPPHSTHQVSNTGAEPLVYVYVYVYAAIPGEPDQAD